MNLGHSCVFIAYIVTGATSSLLNALVSSWIRSMLESISVSAENIGGNPLHTRLKLHNICDLKRTLCARQLEKPSAVIAVTISITARLQKKEM